MKSIGNSKEQGSIHVILISLVAMALMGALGFLYWNNFLQPKPVSTSDNAQIASLASPYATPSDWLTFSDNDIPFKFDYPNAWKIEKTQKSGSSTGRAKGGYTLYTLKASDGTKNPLTVQYQRGATGWVHETGPCPRGAAQLISVPIQLKDASNEKIVSCDDITKRWDYTYPSSQSGWITFYVPTGGTDLQTFEKIVESIH